MTDISRTKKCKFKIGDKVEHLSIISLDTTREYGSGKRTYYICRCSCGKELSVSNASLTNKSKKHCGCKPNNDLFGKRFGLIAIIRYAGKDLRYGRKRDKWIGRCLGCSIEKEYVEELLTSGQIKTCGKCKPRGKDHHRYNPKSDRFNRRDSTEYRAWCRSVFVRDKFRCRVCGKRGWLNAHHLNGWNWCFSQRFDINNGVTLCAGPGSCHNQFHDKYGRGNNTIDQFEVFLRDRKSNNAPKKKRPKTT